MKEIVPNSLAWWNLRRRSEASNFGSNEITDSVRKLFEGKEGICRIIVSEDEDPVKLEWREGAPSGVRNGKIVSAYLEDEGYPDVREDISNSPDIDVVTQIVVNNGSLIVQTASHKTFIISKKRLYRI